MSSTRHLESNTDPDFPRMDQPCSQKCGPQAADTKTPQPSHTSHKKNKATKMDLYIVCIFLLHKFDGSVFFSRSDLVGNEDVFGPLAVLRRPLGFSMSQCQANRRQDDHLPFQVPFCPSSNSHGDDFSTALGWQIIGIKTVLFSLWTKVEGGQAHGRPQFIVCNVDPGLINPMVV